MRLQGGYTDLKQISLLSVSLQTRILWYPGPYNWLVFIFMNDIPSLMLAQGILLLCGFFHHCTISINCSPEFFVTQGCFSGCKCHCVTLACVNSSGWSLPFVWRARTRTCHVESLLKAWFEDLPLTGTLLHCSREVLVTHIISISPMFPVSSPEVFGTGHAPLVFV